MKQSGKDGAVHEPAKAAIDRGPALEPRLSQIEYIPDDAFFGAAYVDIDEWSVQPEPHRYVHGGFQGTDTRFSFYFPPAGQYEGRFFHVVEGGMGGNENSAMAI